MQVAKIRECLEATTSYLKEHGADKLAAEHGIKSKTDGKLLLLDYHQLEVRWSSPFGWVCRGLILDAQTLKPLSFGLPKFKNIGEHLAAQIDWPTAVAWEKLDGTLVNRFWNPHTEQFELHTRFQLPSDMKENVAQGGTITWEVLVRRCFPGWETILPQQPRNQTWAFEICCPINRVVVQYDNWFARILAARDLETLEEKSIDSLPIPDNLKPKRWPATSAEQVLALANELPAVKSEGFVVCDAGFNRLKGKSDEYVRLHKLKSGLGGINNLIDMARQNDWEEVTVHFPEYKDDLQLISDMVGAAISEHEQAYERLRAIEIQKDFALEVQKLGLLHSGALFAARAKKKPSVRAAFLEMERMPFCRMFKDQVRAKLGAKYAEEA